jgi:predicted RNA-binding Zn-ribbon protein involved in translation (DUF1610 family)
MTPKNPNTTSKPAQSSKSAEACPFCGRIIRGYPAISRRDNKTRICSDCGVREAFVDAGLVPSMSEAMTVFDGGKFV